MIADKKGDTYQAALFIVNLKAYPMNYVVTEPITITPLQKSLYGDTLEKYLVNELCGEKLIEKIESPPSIIFVQDEKFLDLSSKINIPMVKISKETKKDTSIDEQTITSPDLKKALKSYLAQMDVSEPFDRIKKVIT